MAEAIKGTYLGKIPRVSPPVLHNLGIYKPKEFSFFVNCQLMEVLNTYVHAVRRLGQYCNIYCPTSYTHE